MLARFTSEADARADVAASSISGKRYDVRRQDGAFCVHVYTDGPALDEQITAAGYQIAPDPRRAACGTAGLFGMDFFGREISDHCLRLMCMGRIADDGDGPFCPSCGWRSARGLSGPKEIWRRLVGR